MNTQHNLWRFGVNTREKLLLVWALMATALLVIAGFVVAGMLIPRQAETGRLVDAAEMVLGATSIYECNRSTGLCQPVQGPGAHYPDFASAARAGTVGEYAVIWVTHDAPHEWRAFSGASTHLGCFIWWQEAADRFQDPCGGAQWDRQGTYIFGPAPRSLDTFPVREESGGIVIDFRLVRGKSND